LESITIGLIGIIILFFLILIGMPIGITMAIVGFLGYAYLTSIEGAFGLLRSVPFATSSSYDLSVLPLFLLMGSFAYNSGISNGLFYSAYRLVGRAPGGLAIATILGCAGFSSICGSTLATAAVMGKTALPEMKKYHYDSGLAAGAIASGGSLGILIPPSSIFIIYGIITEQSIGKLFIAGILPGLLLSSLFILIIVIRTLYQPELGPRGPKVSFAQKLSAIKDIWAVMLLFLIITGGLYLGIFTPTEAAGVGAFGAFVLPLLKKQMSWQIIKKSLGETIQTTAMIFLIIIGAMIFGYFLAISRLPFELANFVGSLAVSPYLIFVGIILVYVLLGCILDTFAMVILTVPIFYPVILKLGFDPIWFGVVMVIVAEMGVITPPVGLNVYVVHGVAEDIALSTIFEGVTPFFFMMMISIVILILFPQIVLFLPDLMK
jgi:C4-dicarboxylate transporter, DctM subunit